jgi:hypothetical protein
VKVVIMSYHFPANFLMCCLLDVVVPVVVACNWQLVKGGI